MKAKLGNDWNGFVLDKTPTPSFPDYSLYPIPTISIEAADHWEFSTWIALCPPCTFLSTSASHDPSNLCPYLCTFSILKTLFSHEFSLRGNNSHVHAIISMTKIITFALSSLWSLSSFKGSVCGLSLLGSRSSLFQTFLLSILDSVLWKDRTERVHLDYYTRWFIGLIYTIRAGYSNHGNPNTEYAESIGVSQSTRMDMSTVSIWSWSLWMVVLAV